jgi:hypothetical protein
MTDDEDNPRHESMGIINLTKSVDKHMKNKKN